jgi:transmembrane sensor
MRDFREKEAELAPLLRESLAWVVQLTSGEATQADADAFSKWKARSPQHEKALTEALRLRQMLRVAGQTLVAAQPVQIKAYQSRRLVGRRALMGGALAACGAGVAFAGTELGFWPTLFELGADYRTGTGERRVLALADGLALHLNTQTSISVDLKAPQPKIELISGEAIVSADLDGNRRLTVVAGDGIVRATKASFDVRYIGRSACVTCVKGDVAVRLAGQRVVLAPGQQVTYTDGQTSFGPVAAADTTASVAWNQGLLIFHDRPLAEMLAEVNRYRPGRIILANDELAKRTFNGVFHIDDLDAVLAQLGKLGVNVRPVGAGIVLVS